MYAKFAAVLLLFCPLPALAEVPPAFVDIPCKRFVVSWKPDRRSEAMEVLKKAKLKLLLRLSEHEPMAVYEGPLTAKIQKRLSKSSAIERVEPDIELTVD